MNIKFVVRKVETSENSDGLTTTIRLQVADESEARIQPIALRIQYKGEPQHKVDEELGFAF